MVLLARLLRIFRVLRLVSMIPELQMLLAALVKSIPPHGLRRAAHVHHLFISMRRWEAFFFHDVDEFFMGATSPLPC